MVPTGYGQQTALFAPRLAEHYEVYISANYGLEGAPILWRGIPVLPGLGGSHGNETIPGHVQATFENRRDGLVFTLYDAQVFDANLFKQFNAACWVPVDHNPPPPHLISFFRGSQAIPIAMSRYGEKELEEFAPIYVPHAVNADVYKPTESDLREKMGIPSDSFLVGMVAANKGRSPSRKAFQQAFEAFAFHLKKHPNSYLYVHTTIDTNFAGGEDIPTLLASLQIPEDHVKFPNQYAMVYAPTPAETMAKFYSTFDVLLNCSMGEGFGVPILEAQACGTPAIVTDFTAMPEVCGAGWKVGGRPYWTAQSSWMAVPDVPEMVGALHKCHELTRPERESLAKKARKHALNYAADKVFEEHLLPAFKEIEERLGARAPVKIAA